MINRIIRCYYQTKGVIKRILNFDCRKIQQWYAHYRLSCSTWHATWHPLFIQTQSRVRNTFHDKWLIIISYYNWKELITHINKEIYSLDIQKKNEILKIRNNILSKKIYIAANITCTSLSIIREQIQSTESRDTERVTNVLITNVETELLHPIRSIQVTKINIQPWKKPSDNFVVWPRSNGWHSV